MSIRLLQGDCLEIMRRMPDASVNAIVTDPPYGQTNESYDGPIAFGADLWRECFRVAKPNAALICFAGSPTYHRIASGIEGGGWKVRQMWGWVYKTGLITSAWPKEGFDRLAPAFDPICYATKGKVLLRLEREGKPWSLWGAPSEVATFSNRSNVSRSTSGNGRYPKSLVSDGSEPFEYFIMSHSEGRKTEKSGHPNEKRIELMRWLVSKLPSGGTILDPFAGSGSTLIAAEAEGFESIGIEQSAEYYAIAMKRIHAAQNATPLLNGSCL